jgi:sulfofructosephosphate aldolase
MTSTTQRRFAIETLYKNGAMTMLALDQRGSMRTILAGYGDESHITDADVVAFKKTAAQVLASMASGVLLDLEFGREAIAALPKNVPLILSGDKFDQPVGKPVTNSVVDPEVTVETIHKTGAAAVKFLTIWRRDSGVEARAEQISRFVELARRAGVISLVEGLVRMPNDEPFPDARSHGEAVLAAAREIAAFRPDIYKAEVPGYRKGDLGIVGDYSRKLTALLDCPWVVLSSGVDAQDFPEGVRLAVAGGASGFLAGRAIWADAAKSTDPQGEIKKLSIGRFERLVESVRQGKAGMH